MGREVIYWRGRGGVRVDVLETLSKKGFSVHSLRELEDIVSRLEDTSPVAVIVDATSGDTEIAERVVELGAAKGLQKIPIIFLAKNAEERVDVLVKQYECFIPMEIPIKRDVLIDYIEAISEQAPLEQVTVRDRFTKVKVTTILDPTKLDLSYGGNSICIGINNRFV